MPAEPVMKRRRTAAACEKCRSLKAKCDGRQPICSRCEGYGYECLWPQKRSVRQGSEKNGRFQSEEADVLRAAVEAYESLLDSVLPKLDDSERASASLVLGSIRDQLPGDLRRPQRQSAAPELATVDSLREDGISTPSPTYLGKVSDINFIQMARSIQRQSLHDDDCDDDVQSYNQDDTHSELSAAIGIPGRVPLKHEADQYVEIYFSTIHLAYPFICKPLFMRQYSSFWDPSKRAGLAPAWLALLYAMFAIGSHYMSFPPSESGTNTHPQYFERSCLYSESHLNLSSHDHVRTLLAQCFYLLSTSQTNRGWTVLGLAVRTAQSIGLHVENANVKACLSIHSLQREMCRRTWYCLYVLDHLLALQLGRPAAIREEEFHVGFPYEVDESYFDIDNDRVNAPPPNEPSQTSYIVEVARFSIVLGRVMTRLYRPSQTELPPDELLSTIAQLDNDLLAWKGNLLRHLRFDLGHTFENNAIFKRQRNMLAIKFHHLRALVHRPCLCLSWLQRDNESMLRMANLESKRIALAEKTCIFEAQEIARMLHNVIDERSFMFDFPWWQMISCLVCACSILLVAASCERRENTQALVDNTETCLKVFKVLSDNSVAARRAMRMIESLRTIKVPGGFTDDSLSPPAEEIEPEMRLPTTDVTSNFQLPSNDVLYCPPINYGPNDYVHMRNELFDPMMWSAQFLDPTFDMLAADELPDTS